MAIAYVKKEDIALSFENGFAQTELLPGTYQGGVRAYRCALQAGASVTVQTIPDSIQVLCLTGGKGAVFAQQVYAVNEPAVFIADPHAVFSVHAATAMTYTLFVVHQAPGDLARYDAFHLCLPFFRPLSQGVEYMQDCKTEHSRSWSLVPTKRLCRILMGCCSADSTVSNVPEGTIEKGHPSVEQWTYCIGNADFTLTVGNDSANTKRGDWSYVPAGLDHSLTAEPGKEVFYVWYEHFTQEDYCRES